MEIHESLASVQNEIFDTANKQQDAVVEAATTLVNNELRRSSGLKKDQLDKSTVPAKVREELQRLFDQSPLGVMRVLEPDSKDNEMRAFVIKQLMSMLPPEFQRFHHLSKAQRAKESAYEHDLFHLLWSASLHQASCRRLAWRAQCNVPTLLFSYRYPGAVEGSGSA